MQDFAAWLLQGMERRGWSRLKTAERGEISAGAIDRVINGGKPGVKLARGIARAFGMSEEEVMRLAGLLPPMGALPPRLNDLARRVAALPQDDQANVLLVLEAALVLAENRSVE